VDVELLELVLLVVDFDELDFDELDFDASELVFFIVLWYQ